MAFQHHAVERHLVAGAHTQFVADRDGVERDFFVAAVFFHPARGGRRELEQRLDGARGRLARAQFQHLADRHQHGDHAGGFEIDRDAATRSAEGGREDAGREGGDQAVEIGHARAHADEREHVEVAREQRLVAAHEERPAGPQHHRRGEGELDVVGVCLCQPRAGRHEMAAPFDCHDGERQRQADPEAACHVGQFGIGAGVGGGELGLERHTADWAGAGTDLADLRMHRAGVDGAFDHRHRKSAVADLRI